MKDFYTKFAVKFVASKVDFEAQTSSFQWRVSFPPILMNVKWIDRLNRAFCPLACVERRQPKQNSSDFWRDTFKGQWTKEYTQENRLHLMIGHHAAALLEERWHVWGRLCNGGFSMCDIKALGKSHIIRF